VTFSEWKEYHLYHKPSDTARAPSWLFMGHLPRIQWMLWFCGLSYHNWTRPLMHRLLTNSPQVLQQFSHNPFPNNPPKKIRLSLWKYNFTDWNEGWGTKQWWKREYVSLYDAIMELDPTDPEQMQEVTKWSLPPK